MKQYILKSEHIKKVYGKDLILKDVSIHVEQGVIYGLVGRNGSGKTTLLRILTGLIKEYSGEVFMEDTNSHTSKVAVVINNPSLFLNMSALDNMREQAYLLGIKDTQSIKSALKIVGLDDSNNKMVKHFSLGMTQRLKLAMALLESPDILILDEPMNGLDPDGIANLRKLLLELNRRKGMTIILSSHILSELEQIATCFGILHDGKIVKEFYAQDVFQKEQNLETLYMQYTKGGMHSC